MYEEEEVTYAFYFLDLKLKIDSIRSLISSHNVTVMFSLPSDTTIRHATIMFLVPSSTTIEIACFK